MQKSSVVEAIQFTRSNIDEVVAFTDKQAHMFTTERHMGGSCFCYFGGNKVPEFSYFIKDKNGNITYSSKENFESNFMIKDKPSCCFGSIPDMKLVKESDLSKGVKLSLDAELTSLLSSIFSEDKNPNFLVGSIKFAISDKGINPDGVNDALAININTSYVKKSNGVEGVQLALDVEVIPKKDIKTHHKFGKEHCFYVSKNSVILLEETELFSDLIKEGKEIIG